MHPYLPSKQTDPKVVPKFAPRAVIVAPLNPQLGDNDVITGSVDAGVAVGVGVDTAAILNGAGP